MRDGESGKLIMRKDDTGDRANSSQDSILAYEKDQQGELDWVDLGRLGD